jgi:uncharacterized 2Fe-2S/4Fe-4S cluster protein (DUF4445 family)
MEQMLLQGSIIQRQNPKSAFSLLNVAGPAFEGARITCGIGGVAGAINHVRFEADPIYTAVGGYKPEAYMVLGWWIR